MTETDRLRGQLETLETVYAALTDGRALITHQDGTNYQLDDEVQARSLTDAVESGRALVRFTINQLRRTAG